MSDTVRFMVERCGTTIRYRPHPEIVRYPRLPRAQVILEDRVLLAPRPMLSWRFAGDSLSREGVAGRVASRTGLGVAEVARYTGTDRLDSVHVLAFVADAATRALEAWAAKLPSRASDVRARVKTTS